ncbi:MAG: EamA family transporter [Desulfuromonadaceae bacterium]
MLDAHVHIERGPYSPEWVERFVATAVERGITTLRLLEHSHRFDEFATLYAGIGEHPLCGVYQQQWLQRNSGRSLAEYQELIKQMRRKTFQIQVQWGLEVCYFPGREALIRKLTSGFAWDFLTGAVHWINGWGFDHPTTKDSWQEQPVDTVYEEYYQIMIQLVNSRIFTTLAHPDSIKCFSHYATNDLTLFYEELAAALARTGTSAEFSAGLKLNYGHAELGINPQLLRILIRHNVTLVIGALCYGASLVLFIHALREIGSARTSTWFATGPFIGTILSVIVLGERPPGAYWVAALVMVSGMFFLFGEVHRHNHSHGGLAHAHPHGHDEHHLHEHDDASTGRSHDHFHVHAPIIHSHAHWPDVHHRHIH